MAPDYLRLNYELLLLLRRLTVTGVTMKLLLKMILKINKKPLIAAVNDLNSPRYVFYKHEWQGDRQQL